MFYHSSDHVSCVTSALGGFYGSVFASDLGFFVFNISVLLEIM